MLGFSLSIAGIDFAKRRAGRRSLAGLSESISPALDYQPRLNTVERRTNPVAEPESVVPNARIATLPHTGLAIASLPVADFLPLPMPAPRMPDDWQCLNPSASWWREDR